MSECKLKRVSPCSSCFCWVFCTWRQIHQGILWSAASCGQNVGHDHTNLGSSPSQRCECDSHIHSHTSQLTVFLLYFIMLCWQLHYSISCSISNTVLLEDLYQNFSHLKCPQCWEKYYCVNSSELPHSLWFIGVFLKVPRQWSGPSCEWQVLELNPDHRHEAQIWDISNPHVACYLLAHYNIPSVILPQWYFLLLIPTPSPHQQA